MTPPGMTEILIIVVAIVILFGATKIPELARSLGKATGEFRKGKQEVELELKDIEKSVKEGKPAPDKSSRIRALAKDMGISVEGKSDEQLLEEIQKKMPVIK